MAVKPNRGIDHLVLCVRHLEAARRTYARLGFTLTPHAVHPWGTGNSLAQFQGNFIELLTVDDPAKIAPAGAREFSFGAYADGFLRRREGCAMLALASTDARRDRDEFAAAGLGSYAPFDFARQARLPEGHEVTVAFSLAFAIDERLPEAAFFVCQQRAPEFFWRPEYQRHANGAMAIREILMVAAEPRDLADFFGRLEGEDAVRQTDAGLEVDTARGRITVLGREAAGERCPGLPLPAAPESPHIIGCRVAVRDLDAVRMRFDASDVTYRPMSGAVQIAPDIACGMYLELAAS
jgi:hypothetical protein